MTQLVDAAMALKPMTEDERRRALAALDEIDRHREEWLRERGGRLFSSAGMLIDELRDEREAELP